MKCNHRWRRAIWLPVAVALGIAGCDEPMTPSWDLRESPPAAEETPPPAPATTPPPTAENPERLRFINQNVQNWLSMRRTVDGEQLEEAPKPDEQKRALITMIARHQPDVFGISEVGTPQDLADIRDRLRAAGVDLPHMHHHQGIDSVRALGLLSRHPISPANEPADVAFRLAGRDFEMLRGILDATVTTPDGREFRFLGVHFKSKRETSRYDQAQFRIREAHGLRNHIDAILRADPAARLVVFGDLNDTRRSQTVVTVVGSGGSARQLIPAPARDSRGQMWTHHWSYQDVYSRIDYVFVTEALRDEAQLRESRVIDDPEWRDASDHRPILLDFLPR